MLTKSDLKSIEKLIDIGTERTFKKNIINALGEFFEKVLVPYFDHEHEEVMQKFKENEEAHQEIKDQVGESLKDHEKRIGKVELLTGAN